MIHYGYMYECFNEESDSPVPASATVNGSIFETCGNLCVNRGAIIGESSSLTFIDDNSGSSITIEMPATATTGTYNLATNANYFAIYWNGETEFSTRDPNASGTLEITSIIYDGSDISSMEGYFEFTSGNITVEDGIISYPIY